MSRPVLILAVVSAMFTGLALGFMGGVFFSHHMVMRGQLGWPMRLHEPRMMHGPRHGLMAPPPARMVIPQLKRALGLSPDQVRAIRAELERSSDQMAAERDTLRTRIARHLTPDQRERFDRMLMERHPGEFRGLRARPDRDGPGPEGEDRP